MANGKRGEKGVQRVIATGKGKGKKKKSRSVSFLVGLEGGKEKRAKKRVGSGEIT